MMKLNIANLVKQEYCKEIKNCSLEEIYTVLLKEVNNLAQKKEENTNKKKLYYISSEFLIGKLLSNNLINLGIYDEVKAELSRYGILLSDLEEIENEPSLGNGGLGRLAACFLDSISTLGLSGDGVGINYHFGLFRQVFENNAQEAIPDRWHTKDNWLQKTNTSYTVKFGDFSLTSQMYDINITGYFGVTNKLHLFDVECVDESIVKEGISFDKSDISKNLTLFLYPDDSDDQGRLLRIYQEYFMVSSAAQLILDECTKKGCNLHNLYDFAVIQINDTHPTMIIPELIRLLVEKGIYIDEAIEIVTKTCAYTNHTILAEALEKWPISYLKKAVPHLVPIIEILDDKVRRRFQDNSVVIIDSNDIVHMAAIDIHYSFSTNGVAALHTDILKNTELNNFYRLYPDKFNNKTNGITFRRWLMHSNPQLTQFIEDLIGDGFKKDSTKLKKLLDYSEDKDVLKKLLAVKEEKKKELCQYFKEKQNINICKSSIFDIQAKRLHEYKRQQLNVLYIIHKYLQIKSGISPKTPVTFIFGAKAAPAYTIAQDIIHLILCLSQLISNDPDAKEQIAVAMAENYNVSWAEKIFPAADISEQISLASKEASGTGNMKFMLNGAVTIGTMDGANVEIYERVGEDNIYIFGDSSDVVVERYKNQSYNPKDYYNSNPDLKKAVDFIISPELLEIGNKERLTRLFNELTSKDWFMTFPDFKDYVNTKEQAYKDFDNRELWAKKMLTNIAMSGFFSSDRTISQYNRDIWKL